jgi:Uma2 family endonuclease
MTSTTRTKPVTAEELFEMGGIGRCELVRGEIIHMSPSGAEHGDVAAELLRLIANHVKSETLGKVYAAETGFTLARNPDTTRAPDVAFVRKERVPKMYRRGFFDGPPDLAVEVVSPSDTHSEVRAKVSEWLAAGTLAVWVVDPPSKSIEVHHPGAPIETYVGDRELRDDNVLPGFVVRPAELFRRE